MGIRTSATLCFQPLSSLRRSFMSRVAPMPLRPVLKSSLREPDRERKDGRKQGTECADATSREDAPARWRGAEARGLAALVRDGEVGGQAPDRDEHDAQGGC